MPCISHSPSHDIILNLSHNAQRSAASVRQPPRDLLGGRDSPDAASTVSDAQAAARAQFKGDKSDDGFYRSGTLSMMDCKKFLTALSVSSNTDSVLCEIQQLSLPCIAVMCPVSVPTCAPSVRQLCRRTLRRSRLIALVVRQHILRPDHHLAQLGRGGGRQGQHGQRQHGDCGRQAQVRHPHPGQAGGKSDGCYSIKPAGALYPCAAGHVTTLICRT